MLRRARYAGTWTWTRSSSIDGGRREGEYRSGLALCVGQGGSVPCRCADRARAAEAARARRLLHEHRAAARQGAQAQSARACPGDRARRRTAGLRSADDRGPGIHQFPARRRRPSRGDRAHPQREIALWPDRKSTRLNSSHEWISYAVFCLKKKKKKKKKKIDTKINKLKEDNKRTEYIQE